MTMFGSLVQWLTSPVTSPQSPRRMLKSPSRWEGQSEPEDSSGSRQRQQQQQQQLNNSASRHLLQKQSAPRKKSRAKHLLNRRKSKSRARGLDLVSLPHSSLNSAWQDAAFSPLRATKSLGRLDGIREFRWAIFISGNISIAMYANAA